MDRRERRGQLIGSLLALRCGEDACVSVCVRAPLRHAPSQSRVSMRYWIGTRTVASPRVAKRASLVANDWYDATKAAASQSIARLSIATWLGF